MDVVPQVALPNNGDGDTDLSFEALTFGEDSAGGHFKKENKQKKKAFKKDRSNGLQFENEKDKSASSVYVSTEGESERIDVQGLLKRLEQFGVVKAYYFKEKQNFGFIQFLDASVIDAVIDNINKQPFQTEEGTVQLIAERAGGRVAPSDGGESPQSFGGTSLGTSFGTNFGIPFSPSTPASSSLLTPSSSLTSLTNATSSSTTISPTPEKPDTILVLKNLPFSLKQDQLQEILMAMNTTAPQSINLHFDNMGVFRGMAFIKYRLLDDAIKVYEALNGYDVGGRKVRVEYKRKNKGQQTDVPPEWQEEEDLRKLWEQVKDFSNNLNVNEISFTPNLTSNQRKHIHTMAEKLKLTHYSNGDGEQRYICIKKPPPTTNPIPSSNSVPTSQNGFSLPIPSSNGAIDIKGRRPRRDSDTTRQGSPGNGNGMSGSAEGKSEYRPRATYKQKDVASSAPADINIDWRNQNQTSQQNQPLAQSPSVSGITIMPSRQPKGPDGSKGFNDLYRSARKNACTFVENPTVQEISAVV